MFIDQMKINVKAGDGGNGIVAFRREKFVPHGGPAGGHGGHGGHVILKVNPQLNTLVHLQKRTHYRAERGSHGGGKNQTGAKGSNHIIEVPVGTLVRLAETNEIIADLVVPGQEFIVAQGGKGGRGNTAFKTANRQAPRIAEKGLPGNELWVVLELKLMADVGLVGVPNAGKSTLLSVVSAARPKIANYPFTTLKPSLGVVVVEHQDFVMADIPGLIEGAHTGVGLGHQFLRHIERTRLLLHLLDGAAIDPLAEFEQISEELRLFNPNLATKPKVIVLNKHDLPDAHTHWPAVQQKAADLGETAFFISAVTQHGVQALMRAILQKLSEIPRETPSQMPEKAVFTLEEETEPFTIAQTDGVYYVNGPAVKLLVDRTYWELEDAVDRAQQQLEDMGVLEALRKAGVGPGDTVFLDELELEWMW